MKKITINFKLSNLLLILLLIITIAYGSLKTELFSSGSVAIIEEEQNDVYISYININGYYAYIDNLNLSDKLSLSSSQITFTFVSSILSDENYIDYRIINNNKNYDVKNVKITCSESLDYEISNANDNATIESLTYLDGKLNATLKSSSNFENVLCTLKYDVEERTSIKSDIEIEQTPTKINVTYTNEDTSVGEKIVFTGNLYGPLLEPDFADEDFLGWYTQEEDGEEVTESTIVTQTEDHQIYAQFESYCAYANGTVWNFDYTGGEQNFTVPCSGEYKIETWGAAGGNSGSYTGGKGAYSAGNISLLANNKLFIQVGQVGNNIRYNIIYNNGSTTSDYSGTYNIWGASGGGSTDIRLISGSWSNFDSLKSRIMVSAAGGGSGSRGSNYGDGNGGAAGGLVGYAGITINYSSSTGLNKYTTVGATQVASGYGLLGSTVVNDTIGTFGISSTKKNFAVSGGNGYYPGAGIGHGGGSGGSSFISGHDGCDAIKEESTSSNIIHTGQSIHYSGYKFTDTVMIDGAGYEWTTKKGNYVGQPQPDGSVTTGHTGNGYARITLVKG